MESYSIETDGMGGYQVRVTGPDDDVGHIAIQFPTWRQAREWIDGRALGQEALPPESDGGPGG